MEPRVSDDAIGPFRAFGALTHHFRKGCRAEMNHRRTKWMCSMLAGCAAVLFASGCDQSNNDREALLSEEASTLRLELDKQKNRNTTLASENQKLKLRNQQLETDIQTVPEPVIAKQIGGFTAEMRAGEIVVNLPSDVLFDSGRDSLKSSAKTSLSQVASELNARYPGKSIKLIGFTDTDPIKKSKDRYETNHHLGFERAFSVGEFLQSKGVSNDRISYATHGPNKPMGTKAQSRRVELVVVVDS
jgi:outer membrane protein OmpA-like peptidoglycan-associated protein